MQEWQLIIVIWFWAPNNCNIKNIVFTILYQSKIHPVLRYPPPLPPPTLFSSNTNYNPNQMAILSTDFDYFHSLHNYNQRFYIMVNSAEIIPSHLANQSWSEQMFQRFSWAGNIRVYYLFCLDRWCLHRLISFSSPEETSRFRNSGSQIWRFPRCVWSIITTAVDMVTRIILQTREK